MNMQVARYLNAAIILVVDIDRGGAFAHVGRHYNFLNLKKGH